MRNRVLFVAVFAAIALLALAALAVCDSVTDPDPGKHLLTSPLAMQEFYLQHYSDLYTSVQIPICWQNGPDKGSVRGIRVNLVSHKSGLYIYERSLLKEYYPGPNSCVAVTLMGVPSGYYGMEVWFGNRGLASDYFYIEDPRQPYTDFKPDEHLITAPIINQVFYLQNRDGHTSVQIPICWQNGPDKGSVRRIRVNLLSANSPDFFEGTPVRNPGPNSCVAMRVNDVPPGYYSIDVIFGDSHLDAGRLFIKNR